MDKSDSQYGKLNVVDESEEKSSLAKAIQAWMLLQLSGQLKIESASIDVRKPIPSYGLDSMAALDLTGDLSTMLDLELPTTLLWDFQTLEAIAFHLADEIQGGKVAQSLLTELNDAVSAAENTPADKPLGSDENTPADKLLGSKKSQR